MLYKTLEISKSFKGKNFNVPAVDSVSVDIESGEFVVLRGVSGSGKTTLLNILGLLEPPDKGSLVFDGVDIRSLNDRDLTEVRRKHIGFIFQTFNLLPFLTALENVAYPLSLIGNGSRNEIRTRASEALEKVGLGKQLHQKPAELSGGQRQRVAIARAVIKKPKAIFADEPTANLDSESSQNIMNIIKGLNKDFQTTVVLATHNDQMASMAERQVNLQDGKIIR